MRAIVIGGSGFVGLNIAARFASDGYDVVAIDMSPPPVAARAALGGDGKRVTFVRGDVTQPATVTDHIMRGADVVIYGAAITAGATRDALEPERLLSVNLAGLVPVLRAARDAKVRRIINLSSAAAALGQALAQHGLLEEDIPADPTSLYAITKNASERIVARLADLWSLDGISVRLSAVFGPFEYASGVRDTLSPPGQIMMAALRGHPATLSRPGFRDWVYAPDVADAVACLARAGRPKHRLYNVTGPDRFSALAFGERLAQHRPGFSCRLAEPGETPTIDLHGPTDRPALSSARLREEVGWTAKHGLDASLAAFDDWARQWGNQLWEAP